MNKDLTIEFKVGDIVEHKGIYYIFEHWDGITDNFWWLELPEGKRLESPSFLLKNVKLFYRSRKTQKLI